MAGNPTAPSDQFKVVTPSDTVPLRYVDNQAVKCKAIYVGTAGDVAVKNDQGVSVTFVGLLAGVIYPISTDFVMSTNTTASNIVAIF